MLNSCAITCNKTVLQTSNNAIALCPQFCPLVVVVVVYAFRSHNWSARQWHHRLQSVVWTSHRVVLSAGRIRQCVTSFGSHRRNTGRSLWVSISSYKHRSDLVWCGSGSGETTVVEGEQNPAVRLPGVAPWWVTLSIHPIGIALAGAIMGKDDVIHKTGST